MAHLEIRAADEDIRKYIENRIPKERRLMPYVRGDEAFYVSIVDTIIAKAQGMYVSGPSVIILISMYVNDLCKVSDGSTSPWITCEEK